MKNIIKNSYILALVTGLFTGALTAQPVPVSWWDAKWIALEGDPRPASPLLERTFTRRNNPTAQVKSFPAPLMRHEFKVTKPVKSATAHVSGLGYFEFYLNGSKVGDHVLDPVQTTYHKRAFYVTFDVTKHLQSGGNAAGLMLGNGFYGQNFAFSRRLKWGKPLAIALLEIEYTDGSKQQITTGPQWKATTGPILFDNIYVGESYDARLELPGWSKAGFDDAGWVSATVVPSPTEQLIAQSQPPMKKVKAIKPTNITPSNDGGWILDMGTNMTGWLQIRVQEKRGTQIKMRFAEHLMPDKKSIDTQSTGVSVMGNDQTEFYISKGDDVEEWEPRFTYHGFRYVQINGLSAKPQLDDFTGWLVRTDLARIGSFESSDPLLNKFYNISLWTIESNLQGILTDCPHREKCAWLGDMHATAETINMNYDARSFWSKSTNDFKALLGVSRLVPQYYPKSDIPPKDPRAPANIAVGRRLCGQARADWGLAVVLVPWYNWLYSGDQQTAEDAWPMMSGYMDYLGEYEVKENLIKKGFAWGDWCPPGSNAKRDTPRRLSASALYYQSAEALRTMAKLLGKPNEEKKYTELAKAIKDAFNKEFYNADSGDYGSQTATAMALHLGLVPDQQRAAVAKALAERIVKVNKGHYTTGILGHRGLYTALNDSGHAEITDLLLHQRSYPSLAYMTETHDLTTWPEVPLEWSKEERYPRNSFSHPMHSGFAAMFHESIGGIRPDPAHPGFERIILKPSFLPSLKWAKAEHRSPYGLITSHWQRKGSSVIWQVSIPTGSSALLELAQLGAQQVVVNGQSVAHTGVELSSGQWTIEIK
ncbi:family 78 glycoside hydrolase catalytic domain [Catenovulum maritimum]|uniref:family 78 glycoside hydrolase catalytic domain n=1 Tax=Catenovulum maritimum TaxID=1513271 RepID=UPI000661884B|nr:family 78 glycoside hydrolase catalytic domain [Catenovulum maritimum]